MGRANAGKTALFALVTGAEAEIAPYPFTTREPARAMADVPDPRLDAIADAQDIPRRVPAQVQLVDIAGLAAGAGSGEGLGGAALGQLRQTDALVHVVRAFANAEVPHPEDRVDPVADAEAVDLELAVADREQVERRLERVRKGARAGEPGAAAELAALEALAAALDAGRPARLADGEAARALAAEMGLLTAKPVLYLANTDDDAEPPAALAAHAEAQGAEALALPVGMELELAAMEPRGGRRAGRGAGAGRRPRRRRRGGRRLPPARPGHLLHRLRAARGARLAGPPRHTPPRPPAGSTPTWSAASSAPRSSPGTTSSPPARSPARASRRRCGWRAGTTSSRRATSSRSASTSERRLQKSPAGGGNYATDSRARHRMTTASFRRRTS